MKMRYVGKRLAVLVCFFILSCTNSRTNQVKITNSTSVDRNDELVVLTKAEVEKKIGTIAAGKYVVIRTGNQPLVVQYDDLNNDGSWDELAFLFSFKPSETAVFDLSIADAPAAIKAVVRAHVRHRKKNSNDQFDDIITKDTMPVQNPPTDFSKIPLPPYLTEGPAWENDKVAFRLYFDTRNGKDVFGKRIPGMVMDTIGANHNNSYHELANWGMDLLHVGKSLGAGAIAIGIKNSNGTDTLIRVGGNLVTNERYEVVADGPVRAIFRIYYSVELNGKAFDITDETSIWGGQYFYQSKLSCNNFPDDAKLVVGYADFYDNKPGQVDTAGIKTFYSYGPQSENKDNLGLAIAVHSKNFDGYRRLTDTLASIQNSYIISQRVKKGVPFVYRFYSGWEKSDNKFSNVDEFSAFLKYEAVSMGNPLVVE